MKKSSFLMLLGAILVIFFLGSMFVFLRQNSDVVEEIRVIAPNGQAVNYYEAEMFLFSSNSGEECLNLNNLINDREIDLAQIRLYKRNLDNPITSHQYRDLMLEYVVICEMDNSQVGLPFLYIDNYDLNPSERCVVGDTNIITHLENI
ncbi:MAG: hypothetical protein LBG64_04255 [Pseudomonadales bacterium]|jgi:hypothetical protein|nr:hypothetical protein [Pseudomonadales bacterium]